MKFVDLKTLGQSHDWEEFGDDVRQCYRCGEIQRLAPGGVSSSFWYTSLKGVEGLCKTE